MVGTGHTRTKQDIFNTQQPRPPDVLVCVGVEGHLEVATRQNELQAVGGGGCLALRVRLV